MEKLIVEIFSGSKTVSGVFEKNGWKSITLDNDPSCNPSICCDFLDFDIDSIPRSVAFFWISVPCTVFSRESSRLHFNKTVLAYRQYKYEPVSELALQSVAILQKVQELLQEFPKVPFVIENPVGSIHHFPELKNIGHYRYFVNYFNFGFPYSKETYLFSNVWLPFPTKKYRVQAPGLITVNNRKQRSKVPGLLAETIFLYLFTHENQMGSVRNSMA